MVLKQWVHGELKPPVAMAGGGGVLSERGGEKAKRIKGLACGVYVVLLCARGKSSELYLEPSTVASRWRPRAVLGGVARRGGHSARGRGRWGASVRRGKPARARGGSGAAQSGGSSAALPAVRESREADRRKEKWT